VYEWKDGKLRSELTKDVQRRKRLENKKFRFDPGCKYGLREQAKKIVWNCDRDHGVIEWPP
jgi:hypothetical protein